MVVLLHEFFKPVYCSFHWWSSLIAAWLEVLCCTQLRFRSPVAAAAAAAVNSISGPATAAPSTVCCKADITASMIAAAIAALVPFELPLE
jgi:hypothetical protein